MIRIWTLIIALFVIYFTAQSQAETLLLCGGGHRPQEALIKLVQKIENKNILVVTWASNYPEEVFNSIEQDFRLAGASNISHASYNLKRSSNQRTLRRQLREASAVFFSGGDQNLALDKIDQNPWIRSLIQKRFSNNSLVVGGTSAGTALIPELAMRGGPADVRPELRKGLGLINLFVDQHFIARHREPRLRALVDEQQKKGIGVDEDTCAFIERQLMTVIGATQTDVFTPKEHDTADKTSILNGQSLQL